MNRQHLVSVLSVPMLLCACATAPEAMQQANHTVKVMALMEQEEAAFRSVMQQAETARKDSMTRQKASLERFKASAALDEQARISAGDTRGAALRDQLIANANEVARVKAQAQTVPADYSKQLDQLLKPLPSSASTLSEAQSKAAAMGQELSTSTRREELEVFLKGIRDSVKENRERIEKAKTDAAAAQKAAEGSASSGAPQEAPK